VCLSGGKDSYTLLAALTELQWRGLLPVDILACNLDQGQPGFPATVLPEFLSRMGVPHRIEYADTYSIVVDKVPQGRTYCALCSRLRRGNLYRIAREEGCSAVVLGHHRDDILETFFLNLFHGGKLATMPPKLLNDEGDLFVLRPLAHVAEADCERFAQAMNYPIIPCDLCGSQDGLQRQVIKRMLDDWEERAPGRRQKLFSALMNARPSHLLDPELFDFNALTRKELNSNEPLDGGLSPRQPFGPSTAPCRVRRRRHVTVAWRRRRGRDDARGGTGDAGTLATLSRRLLERVEVSRCFPFWCSALKRRAEPSLVLAAAMVLPSLLVLQNFGRRARATASPP
jgi:tRNA 2-thiocytidine biosynthesis protein TtcA